MILVGEIIKLTNPDQRIIIKAVVGEIVKSDNLGWQKTEFKTKTFYDSLVSYPDSYDLSDLEYFEVNKIETNHGSILVLWVK